MKLPEIDSGSVRASASLKASNFNQAVGAWEPVIEPWAVKAIWAVVGADYALVGNAEPTLQASLRKPESQKIFDKHLLLAK